MAHIEMDPILRRGIRLMLSKDPSALDQLRALADEALVAKQRSASGKLDLRRDSPVARSRHSSPSPNTLVVSSKDLKREHHMQDDPALSLIPSKRARQSDVTMSTSSIPHTPSPTPSIKSDGGSSKAGSRRSDESDQEADINDIAMEITSGISCTVCKRISFFSLNQLVECQECHLIYHQECHKPPISKADITDPRRVWYCTKCARNLRKQTSGGSSGGVSSGGVSSSTRSSSSVSKAGGNSGSSRHAGPSPSKSSSSHNPSPSKTSNIGSTSGSSSTRPSPFTNLSAVTTRAAIGSERSGGGNNNSSSNNISSTREGKSSSSANNSGSSSSMAGRGDSSKGSGSLPTSAPSNSMLSAERRMQMMKKKAAAKMAERRKI